MGQLRSRSNGCVEGGLRRKVRRGRGRCSDMEGKR